MVYTSEQAEKDRVKFEQMAVEADESGDKVLAGMYRVEAYNCSKRIKRAHKPNLGPYSESNPKHCMNCGKPGDQWVESEECVGK